MSLFHAIFRDFQYPFLFLVKCKYGVKLAWILFAVFLLILAKGKLPKSKVAESKSGKTPPHETPTKSDSEKATPCESDTQELSPERLSRRRFILQELLIGIGVVSCCWLPQITNSSSVVTFAETILKLEIPASVLLLCLLVWVFTYQRKYGNRKQYLSAVEHLGKFLILLFIACTLACGVLDWENLRLPNALCLLGFGGVLLFLNWRENTEPDADASDEEHAKSRILTTEPLEHFQDLSGEKRETASYLAELLADAKSESCSICVSGKWGVGKTSVVNGALDSLRTRPGYGDYQQIRLNALELDTSQDLLNYAYGRIRTVLKENGVYVGMKSEYQEFMFSAAKIMTSVTNRRVVSLAEMVLRPSVPDYRERKKAMSKLLEKAVKGRIVFVLDDIERCDEKKAKEFVFFAREIAALSHCTVVFIADNDMLDKLLGIASGSENQALSYFEKFFDFRIDVPETKADEMKELFQNELAEERKEFSIPFFRSFRSFDKMNLPGEWFSNETFQSLDELISKQKDSEKRLKEMREQLGQEKAMWDANLSNARKQVKIYRKLIEYYRTISQTCKNWKISGADMSEVEKSLENIRADEILFFLAYLYVCCPAEYKNLRNDPFGYLENFQNFPAFAESKESWDKAYSLIGKLGDGLFFDIQDNSGKNGNGLIQRKCFRTPDYDEDYVRRNRKNFVKALLSPHPTAELLGINKPFTKEDAELLRNLDLSVKLSDANVLAKTVLSACKDSQNQQTDVNERRRNLLLQYAEELLDANELLSCFILNVKDNYFRLPFMKGLYNIFRDHQSDPSWIQPEPGWIQEVLQTSFNFLSQNLSRVYIPLAFYSKSGFTREKLETLTGIYSDDDESAYLRSCLKALQSKRNNIFPKLPDTLLDQNSAEMPDVLRKLKKRLAEDWKKCQDLLSVADIDAQNRKLQEIDSAIDEIDYFVRLCAILRDVSRKRDAEKDYPYRKVTKTIDILREIAYLHRVMDDSFNPDYSLGITFSNRYQNMIDDIQNAELRIPRQYAKKLWEIAKQLKLDKQEQILRILEDASRTDAVPAIRLLSDNADNIAQ